MTARGLLLGPLLISLLLVPPSSAHASGGHYAVDGGTRAQRAEIAEALNASSFDWSIVSTQIEIHIAGDTGTYAVPGQIWIDAGLLDAGSFSWGVVQHEYAHEVDFFELTDAVRAELLPLLGGQAWWDSVTQPLPHGQLAAERFASTLAWSYWPSPDNVMRPQGPADESAGMAPAAFRALLQRVLVQPAPLSAATALPNCSCRPVLRDQRQRPLSTRTVLSTAASGRRQS